MKSKKNLLITGGFGFVGSNLIYELLKSNYSVHVITKKETNPWRLRPVLKKLHLHYISLLDLPSLTKAVELIQPVAIFHLAAHGAYSYQADVQQMVNVNIQGTLNLLLATKNIPYTVFVNTGSSSEYGFKSKAMNVHDVLEPVSFYAASKASATLISQVFAREYKKPILTFRLFSVYGPYEEHTRFIPTAIAAAFYNRPLSLTKTTARRDFIYIDDVVQAYIKTLSAGIHKSKIYNIGTGKQYSNSYVAELIKKFNRKLVIEKNSYPNRSWDTPYWVANIKETKKDLQWNPHFTLEKGLEKTYTWFTKHLSYYP